MNIRQIALKILDEYELGGKYINLALSTHAADNLTREEKAALTVLLYTVVERKLTYDYYICALAGRSDSDIDIHTKNILRLGLCQLLDMTSVPDFAAVNETVKLARSKGESSFVNGILRAAQRKKNELPMPPEAKNYKRYLSVKYSFPLDIVKHFDALFGREETEALLKFYNETKYTDITVNTVKISVSDYKNALSARGIEAEVCPFVENSLRIESSVNPERLFGFKEGYFFVQDGASIISANVLSPSEGETLVDVCSAPGGKSFSSAILMKNKGKIHSFDLHESKLSLIESGKDRLGLTIIDVSARDAREPDESLFGTADKLICDAPCSGLGVLGKKPDLRYKDFATITELPALQLEILEQSVKYLKDGGIAVYSTCTLNPAENEDVIAKFLENNPDFSLVPFKVGEISADSGMLTLLPQKHGTDGFFMAKIIKRKR